MKLVSAFAAVAALSCLAGCSSVDVKTLPNTHVGAFSKVFVVHRLADGRNLDAAIAAEIRALGYDASSGAATMMPRDNELVVTYVDQWAWDFNNYMIELDLQVKNWKTDRAIATGHVFRPSAVFSSSPDKMIHEAVSNVFPKRAAAP